MAVSQLRAGAAMVDITPPLGTHLGGHWGFLRACEEVFERLYARALVLEQEGLKIGIVTPELEIVTAYWTERVRSGVQTRCGIEPGSLMVAFPQIHSVPPVGNFILSDAVPNVPPEHEYLRGSQRAYCEFAQERMIEAVAQASSRLVPVEVAAGRAVRDDLAFNRRGVLRDGGITMPWFYKSAQKPLGPTDICYLEGPVDPEVGILALRDAAGRAVAAVLHFTCHPVNVFATSPKAVSSDWPGTWAAGVQKLLGGDCVALVLNGCCGNINPWPAFTPDFVPDHRRMGAALTRSVEAALPTLSFDSTATLGRSVSHLDLPIKQAKPEDRSWAERYLRDHPDVVWQKQNPRQAEWEWMDAAMLMSVERERERRPDYDYEIQAFRVGPAALVGLPGEPFVEGQLAIKLASPAPATFVGHCANSYAGYIAPLASYARGGHEIREKPAMWTLVAPGALERIVDETGKVLGELFPVGELMAEMRAGAAQVEITPELGTHLAGDGMGIHRPARRVLDPLYARALVLESGGRRVCILAMDLLCVTLEHTRRIRAEAASRYGLAPEAILVHVEQNHAAPSLGAMMLDPDFPFQTSPDKEYIGGSETPYAELALGRSLEAIGRACGELRPVEVGWGRGAIEGLAFNRRGIRTDGSVCMPWFYAREKMPAGPVDIRCMEGPFDPEVGVLSLRDRSGRPVAMLLSYACHPVNVFATDIFAVSADWPGAWAAAVREALGEGCVPIVLNGACGNLNPWPAFTPDFLPDHRRMGRGLAAMSLRVLEGVSYRETELLDTRLRRVGLSYRETASDRREEVEKILREHPGLKWDPGRGEVDAAWFRAASTRSTDYCRKRWPEFPYEVQVFRIGGGAVVGLPGEPFVEGQLEIKTASAAPFVCVAHMCTQYVGYIPTREAAARGGHEASAKLPYWAKLAPDSLERIVRSAREMIEELFPPGSR